MGRARRHQVRGRVDAQAMRHAHTIAFRMLDGRLPLGHDGDAQRQPFHPHPPWCATFRDRFTDIRPPGTQGAE